jgi:hypothetical protein
MRKDKKIVIRVRQIDVCIGGYIYTYIERELPVLVSLRCDFIRRFKCPKHSIKEANVCQLRDLF